MHANIAHSQYNTFQDLHYLHSHTIPTQTMLTQGGTPCWRMCSRLNRLNKYYHLFHAETTQSETTHPETAHSETAHSETAHSETALSAAESI